MSYGTIGAGSLGHLSMTQLGNQLGVEFNHIPYKGGTPLMNDAIGNQVPLAIGSVFLVNPHVKSGRLRAIAVTSAKPDPKLPGAAPIATEGVPGFEAYTWWGVHGSARMPPELARRIYDELAKVVYTPAVKEKLSGQGIDVLGGSPAELDALVRREIPPQAATAARGAKNGTCERHKNEVETSGPRPQERHRAVASLRRESLARLGREMTPNA